MNPSVRFDARTSGGFRLATHRIGAGRATVRPRRDAHLPEKISRLFAWRRMPGEPFGLGPEHEPLPLVHEWMRWKLFGIWRTPEGGDYLSRLHAVDIPLLAVSGADGRMPAKAGAAPHPARRFGSRSGTLQSTARFPCPRRVCGNQGQPGGA